MKNLEWGPTEFLGLPQIRFGYSSLSKLIPSFFKSKMTTIPFRILSPTPTYRLSFSSSLRRFSSPPSACRPPAPLRALRHQDRTPPAKDNGRSRRTKDNKKPGRRSGFSELDDDADEDFDGAAPAPLPKAPAGFVLDPEGKVLVVSSKRLISIVDPVNNCPLECVIRRVFKSSQGHDCMLLCPVDMPVLILRSSNFSGWTSISDEETEAVLPSAAYALAKIHIHLLNSGFYLTARGFFCFGEEDIFEFKTDDDVALDGMSSEGVEVTCFNHDGAHYMIYTPCDPVLFVAVKDINGELKVADDDLMDDPAVSAAVDEEAEFNAMVEEEIELRQSVMGERE